MIDPLSSTSTCTTPGLLGSISSALYYDQNTVMPAAGASLPALPAGTAHHNPGRQGAQR